jgi:hypothetical protein
VHAAGEGGADVGDGGLAGGRIQGSEFDRDLGAGGIEEFVYRRGAGTERRVRGKAPGVDRGPMALGVDAGDRKREIAADRVKKAPECPSDVAVADEGEGQDSILAQRGEGLATYEMQAKQRIERPRPLLTFYKGPLIVVL